MMPGVGIRAVLSSGAESEDHAQQDHDAQENLRLRFNFCPLFLSSKLLMSNKPEKLHRTQARRN
jgi:hypothetical protein